MNVAEIQQAIAGLAYAHPLACTNVERVANDGTDIVFECDISELQSEIEDLKIERDNLAEECKAADEKIDELEAAAEKLTEYAAEVRDPNSGVTLADMFERTQQAEKDRDEMRKSRDDWMTLMRACEAEMKALRKKKGVESNVVRFHRDVVGLIGTLSRATREKDFEHHREECVEMLRRLHA